MITLVLEEDRLLKDGEVVIDVPTFCQELSLEDEITLIMKSHDISYYFCPIKKAARYMKSAEFSSQHWTGEKFISHKSLLNPFSPTQLLIAGIMPSPFMRRIVQLMAKGDWNLKGSYLWPDIIMGMYQPIPTEWVMIMHDQQLYVYYNQILKFSRYCVSSWMQELPKILRYIKRFGYETDSPITLLSNGNVSDDLPTYITLEIRKTDNWQPDGVTIHIPELEKQHRYYVWPKKINIVAKSAAAFLMISTMYIGLEAISSFRQEKNIKQQMDSVSKVERLTPHQIDAFFHYCHLVKGRQDPLDLIIRLIPHLKDDAVVTYLHWVPDQLILQLELHPAISHDQLYLSARSQFLDYQISWRADENEPLKGVLTIEKKGTP